MKKIAIILSFTFIAFVIADIYWEIIIFNFPIIKLAEKDSKNFTSEYIISALIIAPFIEELLFRLPLKLPAFNLFISICLFSIMCFLGHFLIPSIILMIFACLILFWIWFCENSFSIIFSKSQNFIIIISTVIFAISHVSNYNYSILMPQLIFLAIIPQFISGFLFVNIRLKYGFFYAIFSHTFYNLFGIGYLYTVLKL